MDQEENKETIPPNETAPLEQVASEAAPPPQQAETLPLEQIETPPISPLDKPLPLRKPIPVSPPRPTEAVSCLPLHRGPAGFLRRMLAFMMDLAMVNFLFLILSFIGILGIEMSVGGPFFPTSSSTLFAPFFAAWMVLFIGYFAFFHAHEGQTPAKKLFRIKVVKEKESALLLSPGATILRSFSYFLSFSFFGLGFLISLFGEKKRGLHDWLTGSYVVLSVD